MIRILHLEDDPLDAELVQDMLAAEGLESDVMRVDTRDDFQTALQANRFDLILADHALPGFDGVSALEWTRQMQPETPFIFVSGQMGEDAAIESLKRGATDYVLKSRLSRLTPAVRRALDEARVHNLRRHAEAERARALHQLRDERQRLTSIVATVPGVVWEAWGEPGAASQRIDFVSDYVEKMLGYRVDEWLATPDFWLTIVHPDDREAAARAGAETWAAGGEPRVSQFRWIAKDGRAVWVEAHAVAILDEAGRPVGLRGVTLDIGDRKRAEEERARLYEAEREARARAEAEIAERRRAEAQLRKLSQAVEHSPASIEITDADGRIEYVNPKFTQVTGYTADEVIGQNPRILKSGETPPEAYRRLWQTITSGGEWRGVFHNRKKNGDLYWESVSISPIADADGTPTHFVAVKEDITAFRQAEEALRLSEERFAKAFRASPNALVISRLADGRILEVNDSWETVFGHTREAAIGQTSIMIGAFMDPADRARAVETLEAQGYARNFELEIRRKSGEVRQVSLSAESLVINGEACLLTIVEDITDRKRAEAALAAETERLAVTLRSIGDGVIATDIHGNVVLINPVAESLTGWRQEEAVGRPIGDVFHIIGEKTRDRVASPVEHVLQTGGIVGLANHTALVARDGAERIIADSGAPIRDRDGRVLGVVLVFRDITEKRRLDQEMARASKLESVGVLAGGIAHDFNNILTAILANLSLVKLTLPPEQPRLLARLTEAEKAALRAKDLTQQLLTFAMGGLPIRKPASIGGLLRDTATFALTGTNVRAEFAIADDLWPAPVDEGQISQVIQNLVINAQQAMPDGGTVRVSADNAVVGAEEGLPLAAGRYVRIAIADRGQGIPEEHLPRIFDPFFTTKQKGSGLGLATAYSIVQKHAGHMTVESQVGQGTTFSVYLPATDNPARGAEARPDHRPSAGHGRVLVMDDEAMMRDTLSEVLTSLGYTVAAAADGDEAVQLYRRAMDAGEAFDAAILDLTVPGGMGGREAMKLLRQLNPEVRAVVSSGYSNDPIMAHFGEHGFVGVVVKPYTMEELSEAMKRVLGGS